MAEYCASKEIAPGRNSPRLQKVGPFSRQLSHGRWGASRLESWPLVERSVQRLDEGVPGVVLQGCLEPAMQDARIGLLFDSLRKVCGHRTLIFRLKQFHEATSHRPPLPLPAEDLLN